MMDRNIVHARHTHLDTTDNGCSLCDRIEAIFSYLDGESPCPWATDEELLLEDIRKVLEGT